MDENGTRGRSGLKKLAQAAAVIGGFLAVTWAMRDRLISIPAPREERPPEFVKPEANGSAEPPNR